MSTTIEEIVYQRLRLDSDLCQLIELERDLALGLRHQLVELHGRGDDVDLEVERSLARAWRRLAEDLSLDDGDDEAGECPLCAGHAARWVRDS